MALIDYTTTELITNIKESITVPNSQNLFQPAGILRFANREMKNTITPLILKCKASYFISTFDFTIEQDRTEYPIPDYSTGMKLMDVCFVNNQGLETPMPLLNHAQVMANQWVYNRISGFYVKNNTVIIAPFGLAANTLRMYLYRAPNQLVLTSAAGQVTAINGNDLTLSFVPTTFVDGVEVCCIQATPGFDTVFAAQDLSNVSSPGITVEDASNVSIGDWICLSNQSTIPQYMPEAHPLLAQRVGAKMLLSVGAPGATDAMNDYKFMAQEFVEMITPRVDDAPKKVISPNNILNWSRVYSRWGLY